VFVVPLIPRLQLIHFSGSSTSRIAYAAAAWDPYLVGDCKQLEKVQHRMLVLLNETINQRHRSLLLFLNLAGKPSLIVGETVACHLCTRVFTVWLVFPSHLFVVLPDPLVLLMATRFVSCPLEPILTSTLSMLVPLLIGTPSRHL